MASTSRFPRDAKVPIRMLGPLQVDGVEPSRLGGKLQQTALAVLALRLNIGIGRDRLIAGIWESPPVSCVSTLQAYICHLRDALHSTEFRIDFANGAYVLRGPPDALDTTRFEALLALAQPLLTQSGQVPLQVGAAHLRRALELWSGDAMEGLAEAPLLRIEAAHLAARRAEAEIDLLRCRLALGDDAALAADLERAAALNPYQEELWALLVITLYRENRQAEALDAFRRAQRLLTADLGLEPGTRLATLERMVLVHDPYLLTSGILQGGRAFEERPVDGLGARWQPQRFAFRGQFVGRLEELAKLSSLLDRERLVTVVGPPGIGKSRLVAEYRHSISAAEQWDQWIEVDLSTCGSESDVVRELARACTAGFPPNATERLPSVPPGLDSIVLLDGAEHLLPPVAGLCEQLLAGCPRLQVVVTSRHPLEIDAEATLELGPLPVPNADASGRDGILGSPAVALFLEHAGSDSNPPDADLEAAAQLCRDLDGVPLALEVAGSMARTLPWNDLRQEFAVALEGPSPEGTEPGPGPSRLTQTLERSYQMLTWDQRRLLHGLSTIEGPFDLDAVRAIGIGNTTGPVETVGLLAQLISHSLVTQRRTPSPRPYLLLGPVRSFVRSRAPTGSGTLTGIERRHGDRRVRPS